MDSPSRSLIRSVKPTASGDFGKSSDCNSPAGGKTEGRQRRPSSAPHRNGESCALSRAFQHSPGWGLPPPSTRPARRPGTKAQARYLFSTDSQEMQRWKMPCCCPWLSVPSLPRYVGGESTDPGNGSARALSALEASRNEHLASQGVSSPSCWKLRGRPFWNCCC